jgi:hypothetical protein
LQDRFEVLVLRRGKASWLRAAPLPAPLHVGLSFLRYGHLGWRARLGVIRALIRLRTARSATGSFADWLACNGQRQEALGAFWEPFVVPALNAPLDRVSAADAAFVLTTAFLRDAGAARFGWSTTPLAHIANAAAAQIDRVHLKSRVVGVRPLADGVALDFAGGERRVFDGVVLAVPPPQLARLLGDPARFGVPSLAGYEARAIIDVHLWHDRGSLPFDFAALLDSPVQWVFQKGRGYLCCSISAAEALLAQPTGELTQVCWSEVRSAIPALADAKLVRSAVTRNPAGTYLPKPGVVRPRSETSVPSVVLAGSWLDPAWPDTMEAAVRSGLAAAAALRPSLRAVRPSPAGDAADGVSRVG